MIAGDIENYAELLEDAECKAKTDFELDFVFGLMNAFDEYGDDTVVKEVDYNKLLKIVGYR